GGSPAVNLHGMANCNRQLGGADVAELDCSGDRRRLELFRIESRLSELIGAADWLKGVVLRRPSGLRTRVTLGATLAWFATRPHREYQRVPRCGERRGQWADDGRRDLSVRYLRQGPCGARTELWIRRSVGVRPSAALASLVSVPIEDRHVPHRRKAFLCPRQ